MKKNFYKSRKRASRKTSEKTSTWLLVIDQTPFLKKALSRCKRLRNELNKKQKLLNDFENHDLAAFYQWLEETFKSELSEIRQLEQLITELSFILGNLSNCALFYPEKVVEMHKELFEHQKNGTLHEFVTPEYGKLFDDDDSELNEDYEQEDELEGMLFEDIIDELFDEEIDYEDFEENLRTGNRFKNKRKSENAHSDLRLKKCYRGLAKKLHPDHSILEESFRKKYWNEMQEAYRTNDLEVLLRIEAICDLDHQKLSIELGLARLTDVANYHFSHIQPIRVALRHAKQDIAFGFAQKGSTRKIRRNMKEAFDYQVEDLESEVEYMQESVNVIFSQFTPKVTKRAVKRSAISKKTKAPKSKQVEDDLQMYFF